MPFQLASTAETIVLDVAFIGRHSGTEQTFYDFIIIPTLVSIRCASEVLIAVDNRIVTTIYLLKQMTKKFNRCKFANFAHSK